jgi:hypothetical protein
MNNLKEGITVTFSRDSKRRVYLTVLNLDWAREQSTVSNIWEAGK